MKISRTNSGWPIKSGFLLFGLLVLGAALFGAGQAAAQQTQSYVLQGRVLSYDQGAVAGATITLYTMPTHIAVGSTTTDAAGNFVIDTGPGTFALDAAAAGFQTDEQTVFVTSYESGILFLLRDAAPQVPVNYAATISGKVLSADNVPLGGMNIIAYNVPQGDSSQIRPIVNATITDVNGNYSIQVPAGTVWPSLLTQAVWGYDYLPQNVVAGQNITDIIFVAQIRVLPRVEFPTPTAVPVPPTFTPMPATATAVPPTATPVSDVGPIVGMPRTGLAQDLNWLLWLMPLLFLSGFFLRFFYDHRREQNRKQK